MKCRMKPVDCGSSGFKEESLFTPTCLTISNITGMIMTWAVLYMYGGILKKVSLIIKDRLRKV